MATEMRMAHSEKSDQDNIDATRSVVAEKPLNLITRVGWTICSMPDLLKNFVWDAFVLFYYTQLLGLKGSYVGIALLIILTFDALVNPYIGAWSDRIQHSFLGRRHTLMAQGFLPFTIGIYAIFSPPNGLGQEGLFLWLLCFGMLARVGISFWAVPGYALGGDLSRSDKERKLIAILRNLGNQLTIMIVPFVAFSVFFAATEEFPNAQLNPALYPKFGLFVACLGGATMLFGFFATLKRARLVEMSDQTNTVARESVSAVVKRYIHSLTLTPNVGRVFFATLFVLISISVVTQLALHLSTYFWRLSQDAIRNIFMAQMVGALIAMPVSGLVMSLVSKKVAMLFGLLGFFVMMLLTILLPLLSLAPAPATTEMDYFVVGCRILGGFFYGLYVVPFSATTFDVGDEHRANTGGSQQQGLVSSLMITGIQFGSALVGLVLGFFLSLIAFPVNTPVDEMPADKVQSLALFTMAIICLAGALTTYIVSRFDLSVEKQKVIREKLAS